MEKEDIQFWRGVSMGLALGIDELQKLIQDEDGTYNEALLEGINAIQKQSLNSNRIQVKDIRKYFRVNLPGIPTE